MSNVLYFIFPVDDMNATEQLRVFSIVQNAVRSFQDHLLQKVFGISSRCVCDTLAFFLVSCSLYHTGIKAIVQLEFSLSRVIICCFSLCFRISFRFLGEPENLITCPVFPIYFETQNGIWRPITMATCIQFY